MNWRSSKRSVINSENSSRGKIAHSSFRSGVYPYSDRLFNKISFPSSTEDAGVDYSNKIHNFKKLKLLHIKSFQMEQNCINSAEEVCPTKQRCEIRTTKMLDAPL